MKIAYASSSIIPSNSANSVQVMKMCQAFTDNGHDVSLVARKAKSKDDPFQYYGVEKKFSIKKLRWPNVRGGGLVFGFNFARWLRKNEFDFVYGRSVYCLSRAAKIDVRCAFEAHTPPRNKFHHSMQKKLFNRPSFSHVVVISHALKNKYKSLFPSLGEEQIVVAHDGADLPKDYDSKVSLKKYSNDGLNVGYVGSLYPGKGMEVIVPLANSCPRFNFHVVGGSKEDVSYWKQRTSNTHNLSFYGHVSHSDVYKYLNACDIMLAPYQKQVSTNFKSENNISPWMSPLKIFEYMAAGKSMVCSDLPVIKEVLEDRKTAFLCDPQDIKGWRDALLILSDENIRDQISTRAREEFKENYTWKKRAKVVLESNLNT